MGMMKRQKLQEIKKASKASDFDPSVQLVHSLVDHGLSALNELEGGQSTIEQRAELKERERQVALALNDLHNVLLKVGREAQLLSPGGTNGAVEATLKARFTLGMVAEMLAAKGPKWHREWSWYQPRIVEEFGE